MAGVRHGLGEVAVLDRHRRLLDRGLDEPLASTGRAFFHPDEFHDAQQLVAEAREGDLQQARDIFKLALPPDPAVPFQRQAQAEGRGAGEQDAEARPRGRLEKPVQHEDRQVG